jgi:hypothetical protein
VVDDLKTHKPGMDRRKFLMIAGAGAALGALVLAAGSRKMFQGVLRSSQAQTGTRSIGNAPIAARVQPAGGSFLSRLFGRAR